MVKRFNGQEVEQWGQFELTLDGPSAGNPFQEVRLSAQFQYKNLIVEPDGFYDGNGIYRIRFMPDRPGVWRYVTRSNISELDGHDGEFVCIQAAEGNHGPVRVKHSYLFAYEDGTPYMPFGTTCYHWTHHGNEELEELTLQTLKDSPFNKVRMCLLPTRDMRPPLNLVFAGTCPEDIDKTKFNPAFFTHLESRIKDLMQLGIEADLVLFHPYDKGYWGVDNMDAESDAFYLRYVIARLASFRNVWWSLCNEYDFNSYKTVADWDRLLQLTQGQDPYQHLRSIHNGTKMYKSSNLYDFSKPWITHQSIQHWEAELTTEWREAVAKPIVIDEISYEGNSSRRWGNISGEELTHRFWEGLSRGGFVGHGESFINKETRAWISSGGKLYGESTERIAFLRKVMEEGPEDWMAARQEGSYMLLYFGRHQHAYKHVELRKDALYRIEIIDTWEMTIKQIEGTFSGTIKVDLPGKPYIALRISMIGNVN
ncbi:DUF5060 domain-containing protein [Paenibacillus hexagrammi]|uniref:DUF5060 domain-containing protein n=1 Tax=Paenibacillus hexagrammi TaxID=2908839 RepID=A0ABY3SP48_9BACL|nr:DUF5060 domain-containing protein [Paenibacillus sp. YPD9-1]UJF35612.1 DUF5060 domain-containing protein [Paenibacillus sp. YPD9-1]